MANHSTVHSSKDELYRQSLSTEEQTLLPVNPIGEIELTETELRSICGGIGVEQHYSTRRRHHNDDYDYNYDYNY